MCLALIDTFSTHPLASYTSIIGLLDNEFVLAICSSHISSLFAVLYLNINVFIVVKGENLIYGICEAVDGEKDPHCLIQTFHIIEALVQLFPDPSGPLASYCGDISENLGLYFPIHFTHVS